MGDYTSDYTQKDHVQNSPFYWIFHRVIGFKSRRLHYCGPCIYKAFFVLKNKVKTLDKALSSQKLNPII